MDEIFDSDLALSIREKVDSNLRMVDRIAPTSEEPSDALLVAMNGVMRTLTTGQMSFENTRVSLSVLLHQLQAKISEDSADSCHAVSLITFTKIFAVGLERVLPLLLPKDHQDATGIEGMDEIFNSEMIRRLREKIHSNMEMIGRVTLTSEEPIDSLLIPMVDVIRTLTSGKLSRETTRPSLFFLLIQLHSKISVDYANSCFAVSLVAFTKVFFVGIERVLPLLPKEEVEDPAPNNAAIGLQPPKRIAPEEREASLTTTVKEEDTLNALLPNDNSPPFDTSEGNITGAKETPTEDSASNPPPSLLPSQQQEHNGEAAGETIKLEEPDRENENNEAITMPAKESVDREEASDVNSVISSSYLDLHPLSSLESEDSGSSPGHEWISDSEEEPTNETTEHFGHIAKLATEQELKDPLANSAANEPKVPEHIVVEERGPLTAAIVGNEEKLLSLVPDYTAPPMDTSHVSAEESNTTTEGTPPEVSALIPSPSLQMPTTQQQKADISSEPTREALQMEQPEKVVGVTGAGGTESFEKNDFIGDLGGGLGEELAAAPPLISASSDIRSEFRRRLKSVSSQLEPTEFSLYGLWDDVANTQEAGGEGEAKAVEEDGEDETEPVEAMEPTLRTRSTKQNLAVTRMTDSEMMELDGSDSSSGSDSGSEYDEPATKKRAKWPVGYADSPARKKSKRAGKQPIQQQKDRPLKSQTGKILPKRSRRESKEYEAEDAEPSKYDEEVGTTHGKKIDKMECQLCHAIIMGHPSQHIAFFHLKKHLFTCPECGIYGSGHSGGIARHIKRKHPLAVGKRPVSHVEEHSAEMQRLQAICFPNLVLKASRPPKNTHPRSTCVLCNEKVIVTHRQDHVFFKHFKKAGLFECPLCAASRPTFVAVREHIKKLHQKEYGKVRPVSHEEEYKDEISALNEKCFPGWKRISSYGKTRSKGKGTEAGEENDEEMEEGEGGNKERA